MYEVETQYDDYETSTALLSGTEAMDGEEDEAPFAVEENPAAEDGMGQVVASLVLSVIGSLKARREAAHEAMNQIWPLLSPEEQQQWRNLRFAADRANIFKKTTAVRRVRQYEEQRVADYAKATGDEQTIRDLITLRQSQTGWTAEQTRSRPSDLPQPVKRVPVPGWRDELAAFRAASATVPKAPVPEPVVQAAAVPVPVTPTPPAPVEPTAVVAPTELTLEQRAEAVTVHVQAIGRVVQRLISEGRLSPEDAGEAVRVIAKRQRSETLTPEEAQVYQVVSTALAAEQKGGKTAAWVAGALPFVLVLL